MPGRTQDGRDRSAVGRTTAMSDMQRAGRVGADVFGQYAGLACTRLMSESAAGAQCIAHNTVQIEIAEREVDETGSRNRYALDLLGIRQLLFQ